ncbi:MAG: hypothetical protein K0S56_1318 [Microvirga sp.]|jgi:uncharacterized protein YecE (DUF72 family)|nr:hypothetical protein [Microvirga sp.]
MKRLKDVGESIALIFKRMAPLGDKMGPTLFQLPPNLEFNQDTRERLARCLTQIPKGKRCAFEFRHSSWYADPVFDLLRDHDAALCISDHAAAPAPWVATAQFAYIRAHGTSGRYEGSYGRGVLRRWVADLETWRKEKRDLFVYFDNDLKSAAPADAGELLGLLKKPGSAT